MNAIRIRPAAIATTVVHGKVTFPLPTGPYSNYTLPQGTSATFPATAVNQIIPETVTDTAFASMTDWAAVDLAQRAKKLGMAVFLDLIL